MMGEDNPPVGSAFSSTATTPTHSSSSFADVSASSAPELSILIIGGGVAGLAAALSIKRVAAATGLNLRPIIFEADPPARAFHSNMAQHWVLWKWAYELLLEMGLGKRLSKIAAPINHTISIDADTRETLVEYPPIEDVVEGTKIADPELGTATTGAAVLPPMVGLRKADLVRMLLLALSGIRDDLLDADQFAPTPGTTGTGIEADLAADGDWFANENYADLVPDLLLGYELDSFMVSASTGKVTAKFLNGHVQVGDMIIGADGTHSKVRDLIGNRRFPIQHAGAAVIHGVTRTEALAQGLPETTTADGTPIPIVLADDMVRLCPPTNALALIGRGFAYGVNNIGNGMIGWNLVVAQTAPHLHTSQFVNDQRARAAAAAATAAAAAETNAATSTEPGSSHSGHARRTSYFQLEHVASDGAVEAELGSDVPGPSGTSHLSSATGSAASTETVAEPETFAPATATATAAAEQQLASSSAPSSTTSSPTRRANRLETAFERQLRIQREEIIAAKTAAESDESPEQTTHLSGVQARDLALCLAARHPSIPATALGLIALADPDQTHAMDILDMADQYPETYTSPKFHPGRVILIGDAAHPVATNATGSLGGSLAISDAALLAKLIGKHLASHHRRTSVGAGHTAISMAGNGSNADMENRFKALSQAFDAARVPVCNRIMTDARAEGGWGRVENNWVRSLWRLSWKYTSRNWVRATYAQMLERGGVEKGLISLSKTNAGLV
ncbi:hypothetical protein BDZ88DRAFT_415782 [Geranomyces variabilis]|nr:hypothetical protein BDZ88DRAFT_415782 [Geranomyces variabilis]KAJ3141311.1 hypothetical protein HDU90_007338 [Geranomyces variabilis]